jgi:L-malate glycosyltransferase
MKLVFISLLKGKLWGGSENLWFNTALLAAKKNYSILVVIDGNIDPNKIEILKSFGAKVIYFEDHLTNIKDKLLSRLDKDYAVKMLSRHLETKINNFAPALIIVNQPGCYDLAFDNITANFLTHTTSKLIITFHSYIANLILNEESILRMTKLCSKANGNYFVAKKQFKVVQQQLKTELNNVFFVQNPINLNSITDVPYPDNETIKFAMVSSLDILWKGQDILLNIFSKPEWLQRKWHLSIFGDGPDYEKLNNLIAKLKLTEFISLKGHHSDISGIWATHHLLLMPSRVDAAPSVLLEAMACGRTAVCTNVGFVDEWIEDGVTGFIASKPTEESFEIKLIEMWQQRSRLKEIGQQAKMVFLSKYVHNADQAFLEHLESKI